MLSVGCWMLDVGYRQGGIHGWSFRRNTFGAGACVFSIAP
jgi:hypothetical protein